MRTELTVTIPASMALTVAPLTAALGRLGGGGMYPINRRPGEQIIISDGARQIKVKVFHVKGSKVCLGIDAPGFEVLREEILDRRKAERAAAAGAQVLAAAEVETAVAS